MVQAKEFYDCVIQLYLCSLGQVLTSNKKGKQLFIIHNPKYIIHIPSFTLKVLI